jgi:hypothetical protein
MGGKEDFKYVVSSCRDKWTEQQKQVRKNIVDSDSVFENELVTYTNSKKRKKRRKINFNGKKDNDEKVKQGGKRDKPNTTTITTKDLNTSQYQEHRASILACTEGGNKLYNKGKNTGNICDTHIINNKTEQLLSCIKAKRKSINHWKHQQKLNTVQDLYEKVIKEKAQSKLKEFQLKKRELFQAFKNSIYDKELFESWMKTVVINTDTYTSTTNAINHSNKNYYQLLHREEIDGNDNLDSTTTFIMTEMTEFMETSKQGKDENDDNNNNLNIDWTDEDFEDEETYQKRLIQIAKQEKKDMNKQQVVLSKQSMIEKLQRINEKKLANKKETNDKWETVTKKIQDREELIMYEEISNKFLPTNTPFFQSEIFETKETKFIIPISITMKNKKQHNMGFKKQE